MTNKYLLAATIAAGALGVQAQAAVYAFDYVGGGMSGRISLTYDTNANTGTIGTSPNKFDPVGSNIITGISGTFSDSNIGIVNQAITGIVLSNPANPTPGNLLAPHSFGHYIVANGVPGPEGLAPGFSYDNLFYPDGAPQTASDYPFGGSFVDIYGMVFTFAGGAVNFWSNGNTPTGLSFGIGVTDGTDVLDYAFDSVRVNAVPEPATWALMIAGFGMVGAAMRKRSLTRA